MNLKFYQSFGFLTKTKVCHFHQTSAALKRLSFQPKVSLKEITPKPFKGVIPSPSISYPKPIHRKQGYKKRQLPKPFTIQSLRPELPLTFPDGVGKKEFYRQELICDSPQYYEISLMKSLIGLSAKLKKIALSIGLSRRHQVSFRRISPKTAGQIIKLKELVRVRLVESIGVKEKRSSGFIRLGSKINF